MNRRMVVFVVLLLSSSIPCAGEDYVELSSWEPEDPVPIHSAFQNTRTRDYEVSPYILLAGRLIGFYKEKISPQSIDRCPFYSSCSDYAYEAIGKYGLILGTCFFIDRHFYRENAGSYFHYELRETEAGVLKLDDRFYLFGEDQQRRPSRSTGLLPELPADPGANSESRE
ncbi:MAG: membrane protein insertion efficiency factor YidD [Candidatus Zixiibacteriota bacterium]|nr:MAG: membrane protein insertion efficiency factor YidD [candidate division Zixibacteria bacterium]